MYNVHTSELKKFSRETESLAAKGVDVSLEKSGEVLGVGISEGTVRRVTVEKLGAKGAWRSLSLAEKQFDAIESEETREITIQRILKNHAMLKHFGLPTYPTLRVDETDNNALYMTDLTRGGKDAVYSVPDWRATYQRKGKLFGSEERISIANADALSKDLAELYRHVVSACCRVNHSDAFFMVVDGSIQHARVLFGDLANIEFRSEITEQSIENNFEIFWAYVRDMNTHMTEECQLNIEFTADAFYELRASFRAQKTS